MTNFVQYSDSDVVLIEKRADELEIGDVVNLTGMVVLTKPFMLMGQICFVGASSGGKLMRQFPSTTVNIRIGTEVVLPAWEKQAAGYRDAMIENWRSVVKLALS